MDKMELINFLLRIGFDIIIIMIVGTILKENYIKPIKNKLENIEKELNQLTQKTEEKSKDE